MRFLHTSDWHVGKPLRNHKRDDEHLAALEEVLGIAKEEAVDCVLVAGDVFDTGVPTPEAERIVFHVLGELAGERIPTVVIAGNHDHPRRWSAYAPVFKRLGIHVVGEPVPADEGGVLEIVSKDGSETAVIAALPWVSERKVRDFESLMLQGQERLDYAEGVSKMVAHLCKSFRPDTVNILLAHLLLENVKTGGPESGEREIHMGDTYVVRSQRLPPAIQYAALGHVHLPQEFGLANAYYCGSLLQCDFGEAGNQNAVNIVDVAPGRKATVRPVLLRTPVQLRNIGSHKGGVTLDELKALAPDGDGYAKVFLKVDRPLPGLAEQVRAIVPNAVDIVVQRTDEERADSGPVIEGMSHAEMFEVYYEGNFGGPPRAELKELFRQLYEEASSATN